MKLSEAILFGSTLGEQYYGGPGSGEHRCAVAAAAAAVGLGYFDVMGVAEWNWTFSGQSVCPECGEIKPYPMLIITLHLNDKHRWTGERIAEWVASVEPQPEPQPTLGRDPIEPSHARCFIDEKRPLAWLREKRNEQWNRPNFCTH